MHFFHSFWKNLHLTENFYTDMSVVSVTNKRYARIIYVVAFFGPFLGLMDCQAHWKAEELKLEKKLLEKLQSPSSYWSRQMVDLMYREPDIANYTLVSLQAAFFIFIGLILLHGVAILILKMNVSNHFKETSWLNKIGHVVESLHVLDV